MPSIEKLQWHVLLKNFPLYSCTYVCVRLWHVQRMFEIHVSMCTPHTSFSTIEFILWYEDWWIMLNCYLMENEKLIGKIQRNLHFCVNKGPFNIAEGSKGKKRCVSQVTIITLFTLSGVSIDLINFLIIFWMINTYNWSHTDFLNSSLRYISNIYFSLLYFFFFHNFLMQHQQQQQKHRFIIPRRNDVLNKHRVMIRHIKKNENYITMVMMMKIMTTS